MATATKTAKGLSLTYPFCGAGDESISLDLNNLKSITCGGCSEEFTAQEALAKAAKILAQWEAVCRLVEMAEVIASDLK